MIIEDKIRNAEIKNSPKNYAPSFPSADLRKFQP
jgi:hypothetical protein